MAFRVIYITFSEVYGVMHIIRTYRGNHIIRRMSIGKGCELGHIVGYRVDAIYIIYIAHFPDL